MSTRPPGASLRLAVRAAAFAIAAITLAGCGSKNAYVPPPPPKVQVAQPLQQPVTTYLELTGNTQAFASVDLVARVQGFLTSINYADGAVVTKGTQLFGIERDTYQQQLDQQQATLASDQATEEYNKAEYGRQATLARQDFASQATMQEWRSKADGATADVLNARAAIELAKINLDYTQVVAPFDGVVTNHLVDVGALVGVSGPTKLATIVQLNPIYVNFNVSEAQVLQVEESYPHKGHLDYVSPQVDPSTGTLAVRGVFENKDRGLLPGYFARVRV